MLFEQDVTSEVALAHPVLYRDGVEEVFLKPKIFWRCVVVIRWCAVVYTCAAAPRASNDVDAGGRCTPWEACCGRIGVTLHFSEVRHLRSSMPYTTTEHCKLN